MNKRAIIFIAIAVGCFALIVFLLWWFQFKLFFGKAGAANGGGQAIAAAKPAA